MAFEALIFDFDGVIADSEVLACTTLAEQLTIAGLPVNVDHVIAEYIGKRWPDVLLQAERALGHALPDDFSERTRNATLRRFESSLREVTGASAFLRQSRDLPRCIASSSSMERLSLCTAILGLTEDFRGRIFSADLVERGKPHPDIFLYAASQMQAHPAGCLVIEDSASGVIAGKAAGMSVIGLCAGSHIRNGHDERLRHAGADHIAFSWAEVAEILNAA